MEKKSFSQDIIVAVVLLAACAFLLFNAMTSMSEEARQFPVLILILFMVLAAMMLYEGIRDTMRARRGEDVKIKNLKWEEVKYPLICFVLITVYIIAVDMVGFIIPSLLFTAGLMWFNYARNKIALILVPCGLVGFLYVLFTFVLHSKLP